jgi:hypothetical protein
MKKAKEIIKANEHLDQQLALQMEMARRKDRRYRPQIAGQRESEVRRYFPVEHDLEFIPLEAGSFDVYEGLPAEELVVPYTKK